MNTIDISPLYRTMVGFDRLALMLDSAARLDGSNGYPPYNIEHIGENQYAIELAVAGFTDNDLDIELKEGILSITGSKKSDDDERVFLHQGIAERNFTRCFQLADHVVVSNAVLADGLLRVELQRELPEAMKPRKIPLGNKRLKAN